MQKPLVSTGLSRMLDVQKPLVSTVLSRMLDVQKPLVSTGLSRMFDVQKPLVSTGLSRMFDVQKPLVSTVLSRMLDVQKPLVSTGLSRIFDVQKPLVSTGLSRMFDVQKPLVSTGLSRMFDVQKPMFAKIAYSIHGVFPSLEEARFEETGWFPHYTFPKKLLRENDGNSDSDAAILAYYRENWAEVRLSIEENISNYVVDDDAKAVLRQALAAYEGDLHSLVCPALFTQVERVVRVHLCDDKIGKISVKDKLEDHLGDLPVSAFPDISLSLVSFDMLDHLYESIKTEGDRERFMSNPIPNRHCAIHGLVPYTGKKSSLNSIFIADYVFGLITAVKEEETR